MVAIKIYGCYYGYYDDGYNWHSVWLPAFQDCKLSSLYYGREIIDRTNNGDKCKPAFSSQQELLELTIGPCVSLIGQEMFSGSSKLSKLHFSSGLKSIGSSAFYGCISIPEVQFPNTLEFIGTNAFYGCEKIESLRIPSSVMEIEHGAFSKCNNLKHLIIEDCNKSLALGHGERYRPGYDDYCGIFGNLPIEDIYLGRDVVWSDGSSGYHYYAPFCYLNNLRVVIISGEVSEFDPRLFRDNPTIKNLTLGPQITYITDGSFERCDFEEVICQSTIPPNVKHTVWGNPPVFSNMTYAKSKLSVPIGSMDMYKLNELWNKFLNISESYSGIDEVYSNDTFYNISHNPVGLFYTGECKGEISIFSIDSKLYYSGYVEPHQFISLTNGLYIVKINNKSIKVKI